MSEKQHFLSTDYKDLLSRIKTNIRSSQIKAALSVNSTLIALYWDLGRQIVEKQEQLHWGSSVIDQLSLDLRKEFPDVGGFSRTNLFYIRQFYLFYRDASLEVHQLGGLTEKDRTNTDQTLIVHQVGGQLEKVQQLVAQIPWRHNTLIVSKSKTFKEAEFYITETIENNWSRNVLALQIDSKLFERQGKAITNFKNTLPSPQADLAEQLIKDPYNFDFLTLTKDVQEREVELKLTQHITDFLLELGKGFAFVGRQYNLNVANKDYFIDLLFYHTKLHCYIVIELKVCEFMPEHAGKLNFYLSAIDDILKSEGDNPSIGILLCKNKNKIEVEYALRDIQKPIGISDFKFSKKLPDNLNPDFPTVEEFENQFLNEFCDTQ